MNKGKEIHLQLQKFLQEQKQSGKKEVEKILFDQDFKNIRIRANIIDFDKYSILFKRLVFKFSTKPGVLKFNIAELKKCAAKVTSKVTYLLEDLILVEEDPISLKVQLRSKLSEDTETIRSYFEIILFGDGTISFDRYKTSSGQKQRTNLPFSLTYDVFEKIINDMGDCILN